MLRGEGSGSGTARRKGEETSFATKLLSLFDPRSQGKIKKLGRSVP
jgi:hypothetical protein